jgi:predicted HicB family RNase H-like nuclease
MGTKTPKEKKPMLKAMIVRLRPELLQKAKIAAVRRNVSLQTFVTEALEACLKGERS